MSGSKTRKSGLVLELDFALACISKGAMLRDKAAQRRLAQRYATGDFA
jgi:hypothetical protein